MLLATAAVMAVATMTAPFGGGGKGMRAAANRVDESETLLIEEV